MTFSRIRELRESRGLTQEQFSELCGISRSSLARYEKGDNISRECLIRIASACQIGMEELLGIEKAAQQELDGQVGELVKLISLLSPENQAKARSYLRYLLEREQPNIPELPAVQQGSDA